MAIELDGFEPLAEVESGDGIVLVDLEEVREMSLPSTVHKISFDAAAAFAEALLTTGVWCGGPVEVCGPFGMILRGAHKVLGAIIAKVDYVPLQEVVFDTLEAAEAYAAEEGPPVTWVRAGIQHVDSPIGQLAWKVA